MANPPTFPSDGRITSLQNYTAALVGTELLPLVAPGNATAGINYNITVTQMLSGLLPALPQQNPNVVLAGPASGVATATPTFRSLVLADLPGGTASFPLVGNGIAAAPSFQALNLQSTFVTSFLSVVNGGIGTTALPLDGVVLGNATTLGVVPATTAGYPLVSNGSASAPIFQAMGAPGVHLFATTSILATSVSLSTTSLVTGPSVALNTQAVWFLSGNVTVVNNTSTSQLFTIVLTDNINNYASGAANIVGAGAASVISLSGFSGAGGLAGTTVSIKVSASLATGTIATSLSGFNEDSTVTAVRIG